jgi:hypothetical protein
MNRYGIVVYPQNHPNQWPSLAGQAHGIYATAGYDHDEIQNREDYPVAIFFEHERHRDEEMQALIRQNPNTMYCPITLTTGFKTQVNPKATQFEFSQRGILPV